RARWLGHGSPPRLVLTGCVAYSVDHVRVPGAAAKIPAKRLCDFGAGGTRVLLQEVHRRHDHAGRAEPALQAMALPEALLNGMKPAVLREAFNRGDLRVVRLDGEHRARLDRLAVDEDRARAANPGFAADVRPREPAGIAEKVHQQRARLDLILTWLAVDIDRERKGHRTPP